MYWTTRRRWLTLRRFAILGVLAEHGPVSATLIAHKLHMPPGTAYDYLRRLEVDGLISSSWTDEHLFPRRRVYRLEDR